MAGGLRKIGKGKWELSFSSGFDIKGKRIRKYKRVDAKNKLEAEKLLAQFIAETSKGNYSKHSNLTFKEFYELWLDDYAKPGLRRKTVSRYEGLWTRINYCLGHFKLQDIKPTQLIEFYKILNVDGVRLDGRPGGLSPITIKHHHFLISSILETALQWEIIKSNPCTKIKLSKLGYSEKESKKKINESIYTLDQTKDLINRLENVEIKYKAIIYLAIFTGCRREEILGLTWNDINFNTGEINIDKGIQYTSEHGIFEDELKTETSYRNCFVPNEVIEVLKEYKKWWIEFKIENDKLLIDKDVDRLFIQKNGNSTHPDTPSAWFRKFLKRNNLPHTRFHNLRHIHSSILLLMGMDLNSIAEQMGHTDLQMIVKRYSHNIRKKMFETAEYMSKAIFEE